MIIRSYMLFRYQEFSFKVFYCKTERRQGKIKALREIVKLHNHKLAACSDVVTENKQTIGEKYKFLFDMKKRQNKKELLI